MIWLARAWRWIVGVPKWIKLAALAVALSGSLYAGWLRIVHNIRTDEATRIYARADKVHAGAMDSLRRSLVDSLRHTASQARAIDSAVGKATTRVREKVQALPPTVAAIPEVRELADASLDLAMSADRMRAILSRMTGLTERFIIADSVTVRELRVTVVKYQDRVIELEKRPSWWKVALGAVGTVATGFAIGALTGRE